MGELRQTMSSNEYQEWLAYYTWRNAMAEFEAEWTKAKGGDLDGPESDAIRDPH